MKNIHVAVVGAGYWGRNIVRVFSELGSLFAVCDTNKEVLKGISSRYPGVKVFVSFDELLSTDEVQAVAIATPAVTHYELTKRAILAGKDVFVEKPLSLTTREGQELVDLAKEKERILMVGHILRYHPAITKLKELIDSGSLGKIRYIYSNRLNIGKLRVEENILWSFAPHDISVILHLVGEEPE